LCARWRPLVDRDPPAELLDIALRESAYALELRGRRFDQARENVKKIRGLVRRLQNRGYATLARVAAHLDHLAAGDEANAWIDAANAVSLMTIHAAKGLEFPVVFLVNLEKGTAGWRDPIRVSTAPAADDPSVSVGDFFSDADEDADARAGEETKRLLYVGLTRARDRLYLATSLKDGQLSVGRGSLAEVMPPSLVAMLGAASTQPEAVWVSSTGRTHRFVCVDPEVPGDLALGADEEANRGRDVSIDRSMLPASSIARAASRPAGEVLPPIPDQDGAPADRVLGLVVHRLIQRFGFALLDEPPEWTGLVSRLVLAEEASELDDLAMFASSVASAYAALGARAEVRELYEAGERYHEVPFSLRHGSGIVRGTIDCLVTLGQRVAVIDFKTGRPRPEHAIQLGLYAQAAERMFPGCTFESHLIYPSIVQTG
jgi:ATP-dependent helicase/nuclease subunit A